MSSKPLSAGDYIDARCTRCKDITNHIIVAMVEEKVVRVQCNTCDGIHNYRAPKVKEERLAPAAAGTAARTPRRTKTSQATADREEWLSVSQNADPGRAVPYAMDAAFRAKDLVSHPVFGLGVVKAVARPNKMEVLFQDGKKTLRCSL